MRALFLDRDGIICHMVKYTYGWDSPQNVEDVKLVKGIEKIIQIAKDKSWKVIEVSNQPSVAKGKQSKKLSDEIEKKVHSLLNEKGVSIDSAYICKHHPLGLVRELSVECECRKPKPGLLLKAAEENNIDINSSFFYGDNATDVQAGLSAGCKTIILIHHNDSLEKVLTKKHVIANFRVKSHKEAYIIISKVKNK